MQPMVTGNHAMDLNKLVFLVYQHQMNPHKKNWNRLSQLQKNIIQTISFSNKMLAQNLPKLFKAKLVHSHFTCIIYAVLTSEDIEKDRDYFSIMDDNLQALKKALY